MRVFVIGSGLVKVEEHWEKDIISLAADSAVKTLDSLGIESVNSIYVGNMLGEVFQEQAHLGAIVAESLGLSGLPAVRVEAGEASGAVAFRSAFLDILSGNSKVSLVIGVEKLSDGQVEEVNYATVLSERQEYAGMVGLTFHALNGLLYRLYMKAYSVKQEDIAYISVICHDNASLSPHSQYPFKVTLDKVLKSPVVSEPLRRLECFGIGDGAACVALCSDEVASKIDADKVEVVACSLSTDNVLITERENPLMLRSLSKATKLAMERAGITKEEVSLLELHDATSIMATLSLESSGFAGKGEAPRLIRSGELSLSGKLPVCTFGGLKARGHPFGATGVYQIAELYLQLTHNAGKNQVDNAKVGMAQSISGLGGTSVVTLMKA